MAVSILSLAICAWFVYIFALYAYRLWFSPIATFPGPKIVAFSRWYEFYQSVIKQGKFGFCIDDMHRKYGPIVRISPEELHIQDADFWDDLYVKNAKADKYDWMAYRFGCPTNVFATPDHRLHRMRRAALNPMFSKRQIVAFEPAIHEKLDIFCKQVADFQRSGEPLTISAGYCAFTGDVVMEYSFGFDYGHLETPGFCKTMQAAFTAGNRFSNTLVQFPWLYSIIDPLPYSVSKAMTPDLAPLLQVHHDLAAVLSKMLKGEDNPSKHASHPTVLGELLESDLPPPEKQVKRLVDEAQTVVGAGLMTTTWAMSRGTYHIVASPQIQQTLREELRKALPSPFDKPDWIKMEQLPYLKACVTEALRISYAASTRLPRLFEQPLRYKDWVIPPRTPVSMSLPDVAHDENIFPNSHAYVPERWLGNPKAPNGLPLDHYLVAFQKGARICLGMNMALAEMYIGLAGIFRRFEFELYETDDSDIRLQHDYFVPLAKLDTKGIRVIVKSDDMKS